MRCIFLFLFLNVLSFTDCFSQRNEAEGEASKPNIIFIFIDDMGYADLSSFGNRELNTPNIDRLADEGIKFTNFYVNSPVCSPSRVAVTTGQYSARNAVHAVLATRKRNNQYGMADYLDPAAPSLARAMKAAGYATAHFGKWHMGGGRDVDDAPRPQAYGFDESLVSFEGLGERLLIKGHIHSKSSAKLGEGEIHWVEKHEQTPIYVDRTLDFIRRHKNGPFYIHLWPNDVHDPFDPKEEHLHKFDYFANNHYQQEFLAVLYQLDQQIGRLLDSLDEMGLAENTLVVLTSDNGPTDWPRYYEQFFAPPGSADPFRGRKWSLYEGGIREPFMARWPGKIPAGVTNDSTLMHAADLFPTLCRLAGVAPPDVDFDGEDMSRALTGKAQERTKPVFWEYGRDDSYMKPGNPRFVSPNLAMREGLWKLLINDDSTQLELYNLQQDHAETENVAEKYPDIARRMSEQLLEWRSSLP
jgi:arylsulfatase A-like enzyme